MTACELVRNYSSLKLSPVEVLEEISARIEAFNPHVNAYCHLDLSRAMEAARASERRWLTSSPIGQFDGVPFGAKDNIQVKGMPTRFGSRLTDEAPAATDAPVVARLRSAGAIVLGKTTMPEFGWKAVTDSPLTGTTRNPWDLRMTPGGSSGGAAAAVMLGLGPVQLGTDGGGSVRIPASFSGCFGFKPSRGLVPVAPASPLGSLFHIGTLTRSVEDAERIVATITGADPRDPFSWPHARVGEDNTDTDLRNLRVAYAPEFGLASKIDPDVALGVNSSVEMLAEIGAQVTETKPALSFDPLEIWAALWWSVAHMLMDNFGANAAELADPELFQAARERGSIPAQDVARAHHRRSLLQADIARLFDEYDLLVTPTTPIPAFETDRTVPACGHWGTDWYDWAPYSYPFNLTMLPAASVPCGLTQSGLPFGVQVVGGAGMDRLVLSVCRALEMPSRFQLSNSRNEHCIGTVAHGRTSGAAPGEGV